MDTSTEKIIVSCDDCKYWGTNEDRLKELIESKETYTDPFLKRKCMYNTTDKKHRVTMAIYYCQYFVRR